MLESYITIFCAASLLISSDCYKGSTQSRALDLDISWRKDVNAIKLTTGIYRFSTKGASSSALVDLFSMVHIADPSYFEDIRDKMKGYDIILYELITDNNNCDTIQGSDFKRQLNTEITAAETEKLATQYHLESQVNLYNSVRKTGGIDKKCNWFIADLDSKEVMKLESPRRDLTLQNFRASRYAGRAWQEQLMKNFFLSDTSLITALRYLSWLGPCPEFSCLLLDWSRWNQPTKAGGLPAVLLPIFDHISKGNLFAAKKLAFAQQLISGVPDSGAWGGESLSDTEVRVKARNAECCRVLKGFLNEHEENIQGNIFQPGLNLLNRQRNNEGIKSPAIKLKGGDELKIAILYGAYHIGDLSARLKAMGLQSESEASLTAWNMEYPSKAPLASFSDLEQTETAAGFMVNTSEQMDRAQSSGSSFQFIFDLFKRVRYPLLTVGVASACTTYLVLGALDWYLLIDFLVEVGQSTLKSTIMDKSSLLIDFIQQLFELDSTHPLTDDDKVLEISFAIIYTVAYVQRHLFALRTASTVGVQWDRGLFEDSLNN